MKKLTFTGYCTMLLLVMVSCRSIPGPGFHTEKKYAPQVLQQEFLLLQNILEANHPSLYWYTPKDSVDAYFAQAYASLTDSATERDFKNKIAWVLAKIRCGHTVVRHSRKFIALNRKSKNPIFPLSIKVWPDSAVIAGNLHEKDSIFKRGIIITAINRQPVSQLVDSMMQLMSADGYADNFKYQVISFGFPSFYKNAYKLDSQYLINYIDSTGNPQQQVIKNFYPKEDTSTLPAVPSPEKMKRRDRKQLNLDRKRSMEVDTASHTAFMSINTFSEGRLLRFYRKKFRQMRKDSIRNLVIDLRINSGGSVVASTRLLQYLADHPFKLADTVAAVSRRFHYRQHIKPWIIYWLSMHLTGRRMEDNRIHFRYFENHFFKPKRKNRFTGNIYVLAGGYTFSAASMVAGSLKGQPNVTLVGEETGGGAYGNSAMHLPSIILPTTGLRVSLPMYRLVLDSNKPKDGRGVLPDVEVGPASQWIKQGLDAKLEKVKQLIAESNK